MSRIPLDEPLTPHQLRIAELLAQGFSTYEIAKIIGCDQRTVKFHVHRASRKIPGDLHQTARVTAWARGAGVEILDGHLTPLARALVQHQAIHQT